MEELTQFENLLIEALANVHQSYYSTTYHNIQSFRAALQHRVGRFDGDNFERYGERVFCYEFYHQLRILIDSEREKNPEFLKDTLLQGEVEKMQIMELVDSLGLENMDGEYSPDFLMHSPGNAKSHPFVIEVKCESDISSNKVLNDINKLIQFITKFKYERGVFISVNCSPKRIQKIIEELKLDAEILEQDKGDRKLLVEILPEEKDIRRISIICKESQESETIIWKIKL